MTDRHNAEDELLREDDEFRAHYREWYEEWWLWELPGRGPADVRYDRMYDARTQDPA